MPAAGEQPATDVAEAATSMVRRIYLPRLVGTRGTEVGAREGSGPATGVARAEGHAPEFGGSPAGSQPRLFDSDDRGVAERDLLGRVERRRGVSPRVVGIERGS